MNKESSLPRNWQEMGLRLSIELHRLTGQARENGIVCSRCRYIVSNPTSRLTAIYYSICPSTVLSWADLLDILCHQQSKDSQSFLPNNREKMCYAKSFLHTNCQHEYKLNLVSRCPEAKHGSARCENQHTERLIIPLSKHLAYCVKCFHNRYAETVMHFLKRERAYIVHARTCGFDAKDIFEERLDMGLQMEQELEKLMKSCRGEKRLEGFMAWAKYAVVIHHRIE